MGSSFDTLLGVYTGSAVSGLTLVASNDDLSSSTYQSRVTFSAAAGTTYRVVLGFGSSTILPGLFQIEDYAKLADTIASHQWSS